MKKAVSILLAAVMAISCAACAAAEKEAPKDITTAVLQTFLELTKIPRPSHHEEKVSEYLEKWAKDRKFEVVRDSFNNVIIEVPAVKGMEDKPPVILQGHMDMVFAQKDDAGLDPLTTVINTVNDGTYLRSDGNTSLGADDGIGVAIMLNIAEGRMAHGPLRLVITTAEEDGMTGAFNIDPSHFQDAEYLINLDSEEDYAMTLSTAAGLIEEFTKKTEAVDFEKTTVIELSLSGLRGGHSGMDIDKGRLNALKGIAEMLSALTDGGIDYELSVINGGSAVNAIPTSAEAVIHIDMEDLAAAQEILLNKEEELKACHADTDPDMKFSIMPCFAAEKVLSAECRDEVFRFLNGITDGVVTMSADIDGLVESSSNLGIFSVSGEEISARALVRSSSQKMLDEIAAADEALSKEQGFACEKELTADPWPYDPDNRLAAVADAAYLELFNEKIEHLTVHAGLECGTFCTYNPGIDMISIGPTLHDVHTVNETLEIASIEKVWKLTEKILADI